MNIRIVSDIHTEFHPDRGLGWVEDQDPTGVDVLVIAGDLGSFETIPEVLAGLCKVYPHVVYVIGNHECWGHSFYEMAELRNRLNAFIPNLHWLHNDTVTIEGQRFLGTTMWFRDDPLNILYKDGMNDFRFIKGFNRQVYDENRKAVKFLQKGIEQGDVVVTHHLPSDLQTSVERKMDPLHRFYVCYMEGTILAKNPALWFHGHSHDTQDYMLGQTRIRSNPYGYMGKALNAEHEFDLLVKL